MPMDLSPRFRLVTVLLLWCAGLAAAAQFSKIAVPFDLVQAAFPQAGTRIGWLLTLISATGALLGMVAGTLVGRLGCERILLLSLLVGAASSLWQSTLPDLPVMMASRLIEGLSHLGIVVATPTLIAEISTDRMRGAAMSLWSSFFGVAFAVTAWLGYPLASTHGLSALFTAHGLFMAALVAILFFILRRTTPARTAPATALSLGLILTQHRVAFRSPYIAAPAIGWLFYTLTFVSLLTILPGLFPPDTRSTVTGLMPLASIAVSLLIVPLLLSRVPAVSVVMLGFVLSVLTLALLILGVPVAIVAIALFGVLGLVQGASFAAVPQLNGSVETRALANGAMAQMGNIGNLLGTPLLLALLTFTGIEAAFAAIAGLYLVGAILHRLFAIQRKRTGTFQGP